MKLTTIMQAVLVLRSCIGEQLCKYGFQGWSCLYGPTVN
jgi:hypothetical protein